MIIGTGIDIVSTARVRRLLKRFPDRSTKLILTEAERLAMPSSLERQTTYLASRFAAKEATAKALGTGFSNGITLQTISVQSGLSGKPEIALWGEAALYAQRLGVAHIHLSISHEREFVVAMVTIEGE